MVPKTLMNTFLALDIPDMRFWLGFSPGYSGNMSNFGKNGEMRALSRRIVTHLAIKYQYKHQTY